VLLEKAQFVPALAKRADLLHRAEKIMADDVFSIPLFARPTFLLNNKRVKGPVRNPTQQGSIWNVESWSVAA
jgi:ABC-type transport system substrate-binding protein